jgi:hypothetical protein
MTTGRLTRPVDGRRYLASCTEVIHGRVIDTDHALACRSILALPFGGRRSMSRTSPTNSGCWPGHG